MTLLTLNHFEAQVQDKENETKHFVKETLLSLFLRELSAIYSSCAISFLSFFSFGFVSFLLHFDFLLGKLSSSSLSINFLHHDLPHI